MPTDNPGANSVQEAENTIRSLLDSAPEMASELLHTEVAPELQTETTTEIVETTEETLAPETPAGETESPRLFEVKYGDDVQQLTEEQLISGNMMQADYTRKTMALSDRQKAVDANEAKVSAQLVELETVILAEAEDLGSVEMQELRTDDPGEYLAKLEKVKAKADILNKMKADQETTRVNTKNAQLAQERELMVQAIPEWLDPTKLSSQWTELSAYLGGQGQDINSITSHRDIVNARKAMLFDRLQSQDIEAKKDKSAPKSTSTSTLSVAEATTAEKQRSERLGKSGKMKDAQMVIKDILARG